MDENTEDIRRGYPSPLCIVTRWVFPFFAACFAMAWLVTGEPGPYLVATLVALAMMSLGAVVTPLVFKTCRGRGWDPWAVILVLSVVFVPLSLALLWVGLRLIGEPW